MVKIIYISKIIFGKTHLFSVWRSSIQILLWETKPVLLNVIWFIVLNVIGFIVIWFINHPFSTYRRLLGRCHPSFKENHLSEEGNKVNELNFSGSDT